jgi:hypothetical protein
MDKRMAFCISKPGPRKFYSGVVHGVYHKHRSNLMKFFCQQKEQLTSNDS